MFRGTKPCRNGPDCHYLRNGNCWFYHPDWHQEAAQRTTLGRFRFGSNRIGGTSSLNSRNFNNSLFGNNYRSTLQSTSVRENEELSLERFMKLLMSLKSANTQKRNLVEIKEKKPQYQQPPKYIFMDGKQVELLKIQNSLEKSKSWFFENSQHFNYFKQFKHNQCSICLSNFERNQLVTLLYCQHAFHYQCIEKWLKTNEKCPLCRKNFKQHNQFKSMKGYPKVQSVEHLLFSNQIRRLSLFDEYEEEQNW